ncbi:Transcriptional coactivator Hfi1/Transcriptional adapter 1 [Quillaja saponaria]|uniref:Transcriptional coactivator Hfi1/Transcriptional adapter 1 n=1 Tax=Quillaja saponaria TaxID=32244 RepID=A0AAD7M2J5_QUISA|nr:Transcriptional coactivator Hfi1/Transcriptional adapter 1 [Quillaja saponaria]
MNSGLKMLANRNYSRIDTLELKAMIFRKVGHYRAEKYFGQLRRLFSLKISKSEFDKFCIRTIGRENIPLHNQLIRSIVKNTCLAKVPPLRSFVDVGDTLNIQVSNGHQRNSLQTIYGDAFPPSPRKGRSSVNRDRKLKDRLSPLGPGAKPKTVAFEESVSKTQEQSATELHSLGSRPPVEVASVEEGEEVEQMAGSPSVQSRSPVTAPLGISMNLGRGRKTLPNISICGKYHPETCQGTGDLPDTRSLRRRLEHKLETEGLAVAVDCVNLLNNGLDAYLKRLIESFMGFTGSRCGIEHMKQINGQLVPGSNVLPPRRYMQAATQSACTSLLDFRVAMELNPQVLGEDWPVQLEKICFRASEE